MLQCDVSTAVTYVTLSMPFVFTHISHTHTYYTHACTYFPTFTQQVLESLKLLLKRTIAKKVEKGGGDTQSWIKEAFMTYDKQCKHKLTEWKDIQVRMLMC